MTLGVRRAEKIRQRRAFRSYPRAKLVEPGHHSQRSQFLAANLLVAIAVTLRNNLRGQHMRRIAARSGGRRGGLRRAIPVIGIGRRMDTCNALATSHEIEKRRATTGQSLRRIGIVEKTRRRAVEEDCIILSSDSTA